MPLSDMQVFDEYLLGSYTETIDQKVEAFNEASAGTIILTSGANVGDFSHETSYKLISGLIRRRNAYGSGAVTPKTLEQLLATSVKVASGTPPIEFTPSQFTWLQKSPDEAGTVFGEQLAAAVLEERLNLAIRASVAAVSNNSSMVHDGSAAALDFGVLNKGAALFGDRSSAIAAWVLHSKSMHDLYGNALANAENLFEFDTVRVLQDGFGRRIIMTDSPDLYVPGSPDNYHTLGLVSGAVALEDNGDFDQNLERTNGDENIKRSLQAEWTTNIGVKGYTWDVANGGKSPNDTAIGTGTNWDKTASSDKDTAGVLINTL
ncbi:MAG: major capsid protein [Alphaproteobacteria bacterium]